MCKTLFKTIITIASLFLSSILVAQSTFDELDNLFDTPLSYVIGYTEHPPSIDGNIDAQEWQKAEWTSAFVDIEGKSKPKPYYDTRAKMLWDKTYLYIAAELQEPHIWATLTKRDDIIFHDNDFEIFIDPNNTAHQYFEIEINAMNTIFDLFLPKPYRNKGAALFSWNTPGMKHAVKINGTLNDPKDTDTSWSVEFAIPFSALSIGNKIHRPKNGEIWRINFSRVQWDTEIKDGKYIKKKDINGKVMPENNWVWSSQGEINMHMPERWGYLMFSDKETGKLPSFTLPYEEKQRQYLWLVYYKQNRYKATHKHYASTLKELEIENAAIIDNKRNKLSMQATPQQFTATIEDAHNLRIEINEEGLILK